MIPDYSFNIRPKDQRSRSQGHKVQNISVDRVASVSLHSIECPSSSLSLLVFNTKYQVCHMLFAQSTGRCTHMRSRVSTAIRSGGDPVNATQCHHANTPRLRFYFLSPLSGFFNGARAGTCYGHLSRSDD